MLALVIGLFGGVSICYLYLKYNSKNRTVSTNENESPQTNFDKFLYNSQNSDEELLEIISKLAPRWLLSPDHNSCEWLNDILKISWPTIKIYATNLIHDSIYQHIDNYMSGVIGNIHIVKLRLGHSPPKLDGIKVIGNRGTNDILIIDMHFIYFGDASVELEFNRLPLGIKDIFMRAPLRLTLQLDQIVPPFVSGFDICLLSIPTIRYDLTGILNIMELPGLKQKFDKLIYYTLKKNLVFPQKMYFPLAPIEETQKQFQTKKFRILKVQFEQDPKIKRKIYGTLEFSDKEYEITMGDDRPSSFLSNEVILLIRTYLDSSAKVEMFEDERFKIDRKILYSMLSFRNLYQNDTVHTVLKVIEYHDKKYPNDVDPNIKSHLEWLSLCSEKPSDNQNSLSIYQRYSVVTLKLFSIKGAFKSDFSSSSSINPILKIQYLDNQDEFKDLLWCENVVEIYDVVDFLVDHNSITTEPITITFINQTTNETLGIAKLCVFNDNGQFIHKVTNNKISLHNNEMMECNLFLNIHHYYICQEDLVNQKCDSEGSAFNIIGTCEDEPAEIVEDIPHSILNLDIIKGRNLKALDISFTENSSDPYVSVRLGGFVYKTKTVRQSLEPEWNEHISLVVPCSYLSLKLLFEVMDYDSVTSNDFIGSVSLFISDELQKKDPSARWHLLSNDGGEIQLKIEVNPLHMIDTWKPQKNLILCFHIQHIQIVTKQNYKNQYQLLIEKSHNLLSSDSYQNETNHTTFRSCKNKLIQFNEWIHLNVLTTLISKLQFSLISKNKNKLKGSLMVDLNNLTGSDYLLRRETNSSSTLNIAQSENNIHAASDNENMLKRQSSLSSIHEITNRRPLTKSSSCEYTSTNFDPIYNDCKQIFKMLKKDGKPVAFVSYKVFFATH